MLRTNCSVAEKGGIGLPGIKVGPYEIRFYEYNLSERPHVHVRRESSQAKFWLTPLELYENRGYANHELGKIERMLEEQRRRLLNLWQKEMKKR
ncbi:MAG: DUF4160 domain-containing protein [Chloroflexota bacterium]|nr:DUF4160 domain-containing protein [Chloroflexota bacterium]